uniref:Uncharacterized protein n=1 Tax=Pseudo-nitzschia australis TaxID=44445 RepID=A0A6U9VSP8_9STRA|mmetsp:Transcript_3355/g.6842  ORF Transcript_3355/g.6842 Transcript_3355/m.6842 type:complete len:102 (+) Transcript_3355:147-452(+)|eukprot:CAMPEP_0168239922 /NCGR_PEP_ID=MMETSP0140_2-20121125/21849_1 /TAXON_ID=44445 /ORGANISM="Pseudo-nitzschia australis, Strain 10249 10 AB" /LENGTH=101 /DNA_ID=CAMNT_0008174397 /DNA_START=113 /DNA_END=418 /DNA_ORIENTATION=+
MAETAPLPVPNQLKTQLQKCKTVRTADVRITIGNSDNQNRNNSPCEDNKKPKRMKRLFNSGKNVGMSSFDHEATLWNCSLFEMTFPSFSSRVNERSKRTSP